MPTTPEVSIKNGYRMMGSKLMRHLGGLAIGACLLLFGTPQAFAAITYRTPGATAYSSANGTTVAPAYPASISKGNLLVLIVGMKPSSANSGSVTTPTNWTAITSLTGAGGYGATLAADTGNTNVWAYYRVADGTESGTLTVNISTNNVAWAKIFRMSNATGGWSVAGTTGSDTSAGNVSITMSADPGVTSGDYILGGMVIPTDVTTPSQFSAEALTQTGITFGTVTEVEEPDSTTGNDIGGFLIQAPVSSGTSSAAPSMTATAGGTTTNVRGPGIFIRAREVAATTIADGTNPGNTTIGPEGAITAVDVFTLTTSSGTDAITAVTVNLSTNSGVGTLTITDGSDVSLGSIGGGTGSGISTGSNTISISSTNATTGGTTFKVKVTPLSHANMPAVPGSSYSITATVTDWTGTNAKNPYLVTGDTSSTVTIDNTSPSAATSTSGSAGNAAVTLGWTTTSGETTDSVVLRWAASSPGAEVPVEGTSYSVGDTITTATVACVFTSQTTATVLSGKVDGTGGSSGCNTSALTNGQAYSYKIFQKDSNGNYDAGTTITGGPFTPTSGTISGTCKQIDRSTNCADGQTVKWAINGTLQGTSTTTSSGTFSITPGTFPVTNDIITVFIDGVVDANEAVAVTKYDGTGSISGMLLYAQHLTIGSADNQSLTNANLGSYDNSVSADEDIFFDVTTNNLVMDATTSNTGQSLYVVSGNTYAPGGTDTVAGSWINAGTFTHGSSTVTLNGTTTGYIINPNGSNGPFYNLTINGSGGGWTLTSTAMTVANALAVTTGTLNGGASLNTTLQGSMTVGGTFNGGSGTSTVTFTSTSPQTIPATTFNNLTFSPAGTPTYSFSTGTTTVNGTLTIGDGTNAMIANANPASITLDVNGDFVLNTNATFQAPGSGKTFTIGGGFPTNNGTFTSNSGTLTFDSTTTGNNVAGTTCPNAFYRMVFNGVGGAWTTGYGGSNTCIGDGGMTISAGTVTMNAGYYIAANEGAGILDGAGTLTYTGTPGITLANGHFANTGDWTIYSLTIGDGGSAVHTNSGSGSLTIAGTLTNSTGQTLNLGGKTYIFTATGSSMLSNSGTLNFDTSTVRFTGNGATTIPSFSYYNLQVYPGGASVTHTLPASLTVNGNLDLGGNSNAASTVITASTNNTAMTVKGSITLCASTCSNQMTYTKGTGTLTWSPTGTVTWTDNNPTTKQDLGTISITGGTSTPKINLGSSVRASSVTVAASHELSANGSNTLTLTGTTTPFTVSGTFTYSTGTVAYTGNGATGIAALSGSSGTNGYYNLDLKPSSSSAQTLAAGTYYVNNNLTVGDGTNAGATGATNNPTVTVGGVMTLAAGATYVTGTGTLTFTGAGTPLVLNNTSAQAFTASTNNTVAYTYAGGSAVNITGHTTYNSLKYYNLSIIPASGNPTYTLGSAASQNINFAGTFLIGNGTNTVTVDASSTNNPAITTDGSVVGALTVAANATLSGNGTGIHTLNGNITIDGTVNLTAGRFQPNGTDAGSSKNLVVNGSLTAYNLRFGNTVGTESTTVSGSGTITVSNDLSVADNHTLNAGGMTFVLTKSGTGASTRPFRSDAGGQNTGTFNADTSTIRYTGSSTTEITDKTYYNLELKAGGNTTHQLPAGTITVNGNLVVGNSSNTTTVDWETNDTTLTVKGGITLNSPSVWTKSSSATLTWSPTGTVTWSDGNGTKQDLGTISISGGTSTPKINLGSSVSASTITTVAASHELSLNGTNTLTLTGTTGTPLSVSGTFTASTGTVAYTGNYASGNTTIANVSYYDLTVNNGSETFAMPATGTVTDDLTISAGTLLSSSGTLTIGGDFTNNGTFTHNSGTVAFSNAVVHDIGGSSSTAFNNFSNTVAGSTLRFKHHTANVPLYDVAGTFTVTGANGNNITITSDDGANQWLVDFASAQSSVTYATISYSGCLTSANVTLDATSTDGSPGGTNGTCWVFPGGSSISIGGTATTTGTVAVAVNGTIRAQTTTISGGTWTISGVTAPSTNDVITVFVDGATDGAESTAVTKYDGTGNITGMVLNTNTLTIGSADNPSVTLTNLDQYDCANDEDVMHRVNSSVLETEGLSTCAGSVSNSYSNETISILSGATLTIGSTESLTTDNLTNAGTLTSTTTAAYSVSGDWTNSSTFTPATSTVTFTATDTGHTINNGSSTFNNVTFNGSGGAWSALTNSMTLGGDLVMTAGTLNNATGSASIAVNGGDVTGDGTINLTSGTFTVDGAGNFGGATGWTFYNLTFGDGSGATATTSTGAGGITVSNVLTIAASQTLDAKGKTWTLSGTTGAPFVITGTLNDSADTSTFSFTGNNGAGNTAIPSASAYNNVTLNASETFTMSGDLTLSGDLTMTAGTLSDTDNVTVNGGDVTGDGTINLTGGTFTLDTAGNFGGATGWTFYNLTFGDGSGATATTSTGAGGITVSNVLTIAASQTLDAASKTWTLSGTGTPFVKTGTFTANSSTFNFTGAGATTITAASYANLGIKPGANATTHTMGAGSFTISGNLTLGNGTNTNAVVDADTYDPGITTTGGSSVVAIANNTEFKAGGGQLVLSGSGTPLTVGATAGIFTANNSDVKYEGTSATTIAGVTYNFLFVGTTADSNTVTFTLGGDATAYGLSVGASSGTGVHTLDASSRTLTITGTGTAFSVGTQGAFSGSTSTVVYAPPPSSTVTLAPVTYHHLTLNSTATTFSLPSAGVTTDNGGDLTITAGTLDATASNYALSIGGNFASPGTFTPRSGTVTFTSTSTGKTIAPTSFYNVTFNGSGGGWSFSGTTAITGDLTMTDGTLSGTSDLTVSGNMTGNGTVNLTGGTLTMSSTTSKNFGGATGWTLNNLTLSGVSGVTAATGAGGVTVSNLLTIGSNHTLDAGSKTWTLSLTGTPLTVNGTLTPSTSTFQYTGGHNTTFTPSTYYNLTLAPSCNGCGYVANNGTLTVGNDLVFGNGTNTGASISFSGNTLPITVTRNLTISANTSFTAATASDISVGGNWSSSGTFNNSSRTVTFTATSGTKTIDNNSSSFYNLVLNGSGGTFQTSGHALSIANDLTVTAGTLSGTQDVTVSGGDVTGDGTINITGGTFTVDGASGTGFGGATGWTFNNLSFTGASSTTTATGAGGVTVSGTLTIGASHTFSAGSKTYTFSGTGTPISRSGTFTAGTSNVTFTSGSGVSGIASAAMTGSNAFYDLTINGTGTFTAGVALEAKNNLTVTGGTLAMAANDLTVGNSSNTNSGSIKVASGQSLTQSSGGTTTVKSSASGSNCIGSNGSSCSGTQGTIAFGGLTIGDGSTTMTTTLGATTPTVTVAGTLNITASSTFNAGTGSTITLSSTGTPVTRSGTFTAGTSTLAFTSGSGTSGLFSAVMTGSNALYNLTINGTGTFTAGASALEIGNTLAVTSGTLDLNTNDPTLDENGSITIGAGGTLSASSSGTFTIAGDFTNSGTFTHNSGTVVFDTTGTSTISGATTFNNFTSTTAGKTIKFQKHTSNSPVFTFAGTFTITGADGNNIILRSDTGSSQWLAHFNSAQSSVTYASIQDSGCDAGCATVTLGATATNLGNNGTCWSFPASIYGGGSSSSVEGGSGGGTPVSGGGQGGSGGGAGGSSSGGGTPSSGGGAGGGGGGATP